MPEESAKPIAASTPPRILIRGGHKFDPGELSGHLALALRLENIGVLLGSGASVDAGGAVMEHLWSQLVEEDSTLMPWLKKEMFVADTEVPNIEDILGRLQIAILDANRRKEGVVETLNKRFEQMRRAVIRAAMLDTTLWSERDEVSAQKKLHSYIQMLARLQGSRQPGQSAPWIFTTNYDLSIEWAAEQLGIHVVNGFTGLHQRKFQSNAFDLSLQNTHATGEARFGSYNLDLVKLHGSLNWSLSNNNEAVELPCGQIKPALEAYLSGEKDAQLPSLLIHPSAAKYVDTVGYIYGELTRRFTEYLSRPNTALIICGYGFQDAHINRLIASGLLNPTLQIVIYYPEWSDPEKELSNGFLQHLKSLNLPRVILCGGGPDAYFDKFVEDLPDPAVIDDLPADARRLLNQLARGVSSKVDPGASE